MSMTSAVSPALRQQIINILTGGLKLSNAFLEFRLQYTYSLRTVQEATQKMTKDGTLVKTVEYGSTLYSLSNAGATSTVAAGATASSSI